MTSMSRRNLLRTGLAAGALTAVGAPALTGCSNEGRGGGGSQADNDAVNLPAYIPYEGVKADLKGENGVPNGMLAYPKDPVEATDGPPGDGKPVTGMSLTNTPAPPSLAKNDFWQEYNKRLGFEFKQSLIPSADYQKKFATVVAGDKLPDIFVVTGGIAPQMPSMLSAKAVDVTEHLSGDNIKKYPFLANIPTDSWRMCVYGGKIFGVPVPRGPMSSQTLYGRRDALEKRGLTGQPESLETFHALCKEVTAAKSRAWALGAVPLSFLRQMFEIPNGWSMDDSGKLTNQLEHERQKEALEAGRKLVQEKLLHPDSFSVEQPQRKVWQTNGTTMFIPDTFSAWADFSNFPSPKSFRLEAYAPPKADGGGMARMHLASPTHNMTSINIKSKDRVEALLGFLNHLAAPFGTAEHCFKYFGVEGVHHKLEGTDPVLTDKGRSETQLSLKYMAEGPWTLYQAGEPEVAEDQFAAQTKVVPDALPNPALGMYSETESRKGGQIGSAIGDLETDIFQGRKPVSAWDAAVKKWKKDGGDKIRDELQAAIAESKGA